MYLRLSKKAFENGEVPIGAVVVNQGKILGIGHNMCEEKKSQTFHAEMVVLAQIRDLDLKNGTIYITHEPCPMCLGAIIEAGIKNIVYGAPEPRWGCLGGAVDLQSVYSLAVTAGVLLGECRDIIINFFKIRRAACKQ